MRLFYLTQYCWRLAILTLVLAGTQAVQVNASDDLEFQYQKLAKEILVKLRDAKTQSVGVLKFSVRIGDGAFPRSVGTLNMRLAEKLELALVMGNPAQENQVANQVGVLRAASDIADTIVGANHLTPEGRKLLFSKEYPLAWEIRGKSAATPDAFIVGVAQIRSNLRDMDLELQLLSKSDLKLQPLAKMTVRTDLEDLIDSGESFTTRGLFDNGKITESGKKVELVVKRSSDIRQETLGKSQAQASRQHPLALTSDAPINFEVWYGNNLQPIEFRDGAAFVKEPLEGQKVSFLVRRKGADKKRYGILIRVNGENTLYRERTPDTRTSLWILEPNLKEFSVQGFQIDSGVRQDFRVLSDKDSQKRIIDYGRDVGMISVVVFQENIVPKETLSEEALDLAVQSQTKLPPKTAPTRGQLGKSLFDQLLAQDGTRGLIAEGESKVSAIKTVSFERDSIPVMVTSIRYYTPR